MRRLLVAAAGAALIVTGWPAVATAAPADTTPPEVHSIQLSRTTIEVYGLQSDLLSVSVHLTDDTGVVENGDWLGGPVTALLIGPPGKWVQLRLGSGTPRDGIYTGGIAVTSQWRGTYEPTRVYAADTGLNQLSVDPRTLFDVPAVEVISSGRPVVALTLSPDPVFPNGAVTQTVRVTNEDTGQPWEDVPVALGYDNSCPEEGIRGPVGFTGRNGTFTRTLPAGSIYQQVMCAWVTGDNVPGQPATRMSSVAASVRYKYVVTARPAAASAPAGANVAVTGTLTPAQQGKELELQRLYGDGSWRTVNRGRTDPDSRFRILATPPGRATYSYRVFARTEEDRSGNTSPPFTIRGT